MMYQKFRHQMSENRATANLFLSSKSATILILNTVPKLRAPESSIFTFILESILFTCGGTSGISEQDWKKNLDISDVSSLVRVILFVLAFFKRNENILSLCRSISLAWLYLFRLLT